MGVNEEVFDHWSKKSTLFSGCLWVCWGISGKLLELNSSLVRGRPFSTFWFSSSIFCSYFLYSWAYRPSNWFYDIDVILCTIIGYSSWFMGVMKFIIWIVYTLFACNLFPASISSWFWGGGDFFSSGYFSSIYLGYYFLGDYIFSGSLWMFSTDGVFFIYFFSSMVLVEGGSSMKTLDGLDLRCLLLIFMLICSFMLSV